MSVDYSSKYEAIVAELAAKDQILDTVKNEFNKKVQEAAHAEQALQIKLQLVMEQSERSVDDYNKKLKLNEEEQAIMKERYEVTLQEAKAVKEALTLQVDRLEKDVAEKEAALQKLAEDSEEKIRNLQEKLARVSTDLGKNSQVAEERIEVLMREIAEMKQLVTTKSEALIESDSRLKIFMAEVQHKQEEMALSHEEQLKKIKVLLGEKTQQVESFEQEVDKLKRDCESHVNHGNEKENLISKFSRSE